MSAWVHDLTSDDVFGGIATFTYTADSTSETVMVDSSSTYYHSQDYPWVEISGSGCKQIMAENPERRMKMRGLFEVWVVDPEETTILTRREVIAKDEAMAKIVALKDLILDKDLDDYDVIVRRLGDVRAKKEVQEVRMVKD